MPEQNPLHHHHWHSVDKYICSIDGYDIRHYSKIKDTYAVIGERDYHVFRITDTAVRTESLCDEFSPEYKRRYFVFKKFLKSLDPSISPNSDIPLA